MSQVQTCLTGAPGHRSEEKRMQKRVQVGVKTNGET